jgi:hypothetical protein
MGYKDNYCAEHGLHYDSMDGCPECDRIVESILPSPDSEGGDYALVGRSALVTVGNISVYIARTDEGVSVDLYPHGQEMADSLAGTWATFAEAEAEIDDAG